MGDFVYIFGGLTADKSSGYAMPSNKVHRLHVPSLLRGSLQIDSATVLNTFEPCYITKKGLKTLTVFSNNSVWEFSVATHRAAAAEVTELPPDEPASRGDGAAQVQETDDDVEVNTDSDNDVKDKVHVVKIPVMMMTAMQMLMNYFVTIRIVNTIILVKKDR